MGHRAGGARRWLMGLALVSAGFGAGVLSGLPLPVDAEARPNPYARLDTLGKVLSYIERSYVDPVDQGKLIDAAIAGMVSSLDTHSSWLTPAEVQALRQEADADKVGVGLELVRRGEALVVLAPIDGGPAAKAGLRPGDALLTIDGQDATGLSPWDAVGRLRGEPGSSVSLEVSRVGGVGQAGERLTFHLERALIRYDAVLSRQVAPGIALIRVRAFQEGVGQEVAAALEVASQAPGGLRGVILDVRDNPGGFFLEGVMVADLFLDSGLIVSTEGRGASQRQRFEASAAETRFKGPVALLVNEGSASASEILAGALKDHGRAVLIGARTFGKGSVQTMVDIKDGSALKLTTARYRTPRGLSIDGVGVPPDVEVPSSVGAADPALGRALAHLKAIGASNQEEDP